MVETGRGGQEETPLETPEVQGTAIIICERKRAPYGIKCVLGFFDKHGCTY